MDAGTIGEWTPTQLIKFVRDLNEQQPTTYLRTLRVDALEAATSLTLNGTLSFPKVLAYSRIGGAGQPAFTNSWVNYNTGGHPDAMYWKDPLGFIHLKGAIKNGTVGSSAFTLPPGYRPPEYMSFPTLSGASLATASIGRVDINTDGTVTPQTAAANGYVGLNGIYFRLTS